MSQRNPGPAKSIAWVSGSAFVVLAILVHLHVTDSLDRHWRGVFRPHDEWTDLQIRLDHIVEGLRPLFMAGLLAAVALLWALWRRSWWPIAFAAALGGLAILTTGLTKFIIGRPDPHEVMSAHGGSFPSGHTVSVIVCLGGALMLVRARTHWWQWVIITLVAVTMGYALLVEAAHWVTDVLGGALLAATLVASASTWRLRARSAVGESSDLTDSQEDPRGADSTAVGDLSP